MTDPLAPAGDSSREDWRRFALLAAILIIFRSAVFMFWPQVHFDSDQADPRAHGEAHRRTPCVPRVHVRAELSAGSRGLARRTVFRSRGNVRRDTEAAAAPHERRNRALLLRTFCRETGLRPALAFAASLFFVLPAPGTAAQLVEASGENIEPFLYIVLLWLTRNRPNWEG